MATIIDIANKVGVAKSTVSNVLTGRKYVSDDIKEKVLQACKELDYQPNFFASTLSAKNKTNIIGLFLEQSEVQTYKNFYSSLIEGTLSTLSMHKINLLIYNGLSEDEITNKLKLGRSPIDGAIILSPTINDARITALGKNLIPFIVIGRTDNQDNINYVDTNNLSLTYEITKQMINKGYQKICLINAKDNLIVSKERDEGFKNAVKELKAKSSTIYHSKNSTTVDGYLFAKEAIENGYNAIIVASPTIAIGVYQACNELNKEIGKDVVIFSLGFSSGDKKSFVPSLSYATQDYYQFGCVASSYLMEIIKGNINSAKEIIESQIHYHNSFRY